MKYRWIYERKVKYKDRVYTNYVVYINDRYRYSSTILDYAIQFVFNYADKHGIEPFKVLKTGKHPRV